MDFDINNISQSTAAVLAATIGAVATITTSMMSLRMSWKKELVERANQKPVTKKAKRGPILPLFAILIASAIGGFALSHYLNSTSRADSEMLETELRAKIEQLSASTQRLETVSLNGVDAIAQQARDEERRKRGVEGNTALIVLDKCVAISSDGQSQGAACSEGIARPVRICTEIPADASVATIDLFARPENDVRPWNDNRVITGSDFGGGRFTNHTSERIISDSTKQVCQELLFWSSEHSITARIVVHYGTAS